MSILERIEAHGGEVIRDEWRFTIKRGRLPSEAMEWLQRPQSRAQLCSEVWPEFDAFEERAAIMEYDAGMPRAEAEAAAYVTVMGGGKC